jgi:hypothetical protein
MYLGNGGALALFVGRGGGGGPYFCWLWPNVAASRRKGGTPCSLTHECTKTMRSGHRHVVHCSLVQNMRLRFHS